MGNKRPEDYQLKVRTHPCMTAINRLSITSASKMREHEKIIVGYSGITIQTFTFNKSKIVVSSNFDVFNSLLLKLSSPIEIKGNKVLWDSISSSSIIEFLSNYQQDYHNTDFLCSYIYKQNDNNKLNLWNVALVLDSGKKVRAKGKLEGMETMQFLFNINGNILSGGLPARDFYEGLSELSVRGGKNAILD